MGRVETTLFKMTIAYYIASPTWGGGEQYVYDLARSLEEIYNITPVFLFPKNSDHNMVARFKEIGECPEFQYAHKCWRFSRWAGKKLAEILDQYAVDILHINSRQSYFLGVFAKHYAHRPIRLITVQHLVRQAKNTFFWRWAYHRIDTLICVSQKVKQTYLSTWQEQNCPFREVQVVINSVPAQQVECNYTTSDRPTIFYHGRICQEKGVIELARALEQLQDVSFQLVLAGSIAPNFAMAWESYLEQSPIRDRIVCLGFRTDVQSLIPKYQIGVLPSLVPEAGPLSLLENMAFGLPTISSDNGSQPEYICDGENGVLCPPGDIDAWSCAIRKLLTHPNLASQMAKKAQKDFFNKFSYDQFIKKMIQIYLSK